MAFEGLRRRIKKAQANAHAGEMLLSIAKMLENGAYYDELTDNEKNVYCAYYGIDRQDLEALNGYVLGNLHFKIERRPGKITETQFRDNVRETEALVNGFKREYNAPEARAKREAERQELQKIGALRKAAFYRGEDMNKYPLPWEKKGAEV